MLFSSADKRLIENSPEKEGAVENIIVKIIT